MYNTIILNNGVRIVSEPMPYMRSASVGIWVGVGSRFEKAGEEGSAHFIEHMLFKGTKNSTASQLAARMDAIGGQINAFTTRDSTCFYARVLDSHLDEASDILSEMFFDSLFSEEDVQNERNVVLEEIDMYKDTPEDLVVEQLVTKTLPGSLGRPVLGKVSSLCKMTGASLKAFKDREYTPERIVISVCGNYTDSNLQRIADRFSCLPTGKTKQPMRCHYKAGTVLKKKATEQNHLCLIWPGLSDRDEKRFAWQILSMVLGGGMSSRLFQTVREQYGLCYSIGSFTASYPDIGLFGISTAVNKEVEGKALDLIMDEIRSFRDDGITEKELSCAREMVKSSLVMALESTSARMNRLGSAVLQLGSCPSPDEVIEKYDAVTPEDVRSLAEWTFTEEMLSFSAVGRTNSPENYLSHLHL